MPCEDGTGGWFINVVDERDDKIDEIAIADV